MTRKFFIGFMLLVFNFSLSFAEYSFQHDLHLSYTPGKSSKVMILAHGMGGNYKIAGSVNVENSLISFNFPDYDYGRRIKEADQTTYGTINELLPFLYVIKKCVLIDGHQEVDLYGFSAGGGAIINVISVLNTTRHDESLQKIGIFQNEKEKMLQAIQKGVIILDTPLKSVREIIDFRGSSKELEIIGKRYKENDMEPIDSLKNLNGLSLHFIVHFQNPDEILSNRDDDLYFAALKKHNLNGTTKLVIGSDNGHAIPHPSLWEFYYKQNNSN